MTDLNETYKCIVCGNLVQVVHAGAGQLVCCGKPMNLLSEKTNDEGKEKHVPVIEKTSSGIRIKVGSVAHPMEEKHYIEWIEIAIDDARYRKFLEAGDEPEAEFKAKGSKIEAGAYCNVHGLWKAKH